MKQTRRKAIGTIIAGAAALGGFRQVSADSSSQLPDAALDGYRSGPLGPSDSIQTLASERPVAMIIPDAEVDAEVEVSEIVDGQMLNPSGPWVISWYEGTGMMHEMRRNILFSGHVDYWDVGPAVLRFIASMPEGTPIQLLGEKGGEATYAIEFIERVTLAEMTSDKMREITAPTSYEALTIITCGGEFDYAAGEYLQRDIIRARLILGEESGTAITEDPKQAATQEAVAEEKPKAEQSSPQTLTATVTDDDVNVRAKPSTDGAPVGAASAGDTVSITGDAVDGDGYSWYPVKLKNGTEGFIVAEFLQIAP